MADMKKSDGDFFSSGVSAANTTSIDKAFAETSKVLFGKSLSGIEKYGEWLGRRMPKISRQKSCVSGKEVLLPDYSIFACAPKERLAGLESLQELGKRQMDVAGGENVSAITKNLGNISIYITDLQLGENRAVYESVIYNNLHDAYRITDAFNAKHIAYNFFTDLNDHTFGVGKTISSNFCIHCYNSKNLNRAFEADACRNCSDIMFCHNCENVRDSIFCCNAKNLRYAVCNVQVGKEEYERIRKILVDYVLSELEKKGSLDFDVFEVGCLKKTKR